MTVPEVQREDADRKLLLAQALDAYLAGERSTGGGLAAIEGSPETLRVEVGELGRLAKVLGSASKDVSPAPAFRAGARARLMGRLAEDVLAERTAPIAVLPPNVTPIVARRRQLVLWAGRIAAGMIAVLVAGFATVNASASALPGDPLYGVKQASEALQVSLAPDDDARTLALLQQANARIDEATRLADAGRADAVDNTVQRYDATIQQVGSLIGQPGAQSSSASGDGEPRAAVETALSEHQQVLEAVLARAPEAAKPGLERALEASSQGLARARGAKAAEAGSPTTNQPTAASTATPPSVPAAAVTSTTAVRPVTVGPEEDRGRGDERANPGRGPAVQPGERGRPAGPPGKPQASIGESEATPTLSAGSVVADQPGDADNAESGRGNGQAADATGQNNESRGRGEGRGLGNASAPSSQGASGQDQGSTATAVPPLQVAPVTTPGGDRTGPPGRSGQSPAQGQGQGQSQGRGRGR